MWRRTRPVFAAARLALVSLIALCALLRPARAAIELPVGDVNAPIAIRAASATSWRQGEYEIWVVRGDVTISQGAVNAKSEEGVLWVQRAESYSGQPSRIIAYLEATQQSSAGPPQMVRVDFGRAGNANSVSGRSAQSLEARSWLGRFQTFAGIELSAPLGGAPQPSQPPIFERGRLAREQEMVPRAEVAPAQFVREEIAPPATATVVPNGQRVQFFARGGGRFNMPSFNDEQRGERVVLITSGVQIVVDNIDQLGTVVVETDRLVFWAPLSGPGGAAASEGPLELYMEGNIVFRQGDRVVYADRMYYNVRQEYGVVLNAEMLTPVAEYQGLLRLKAEVLQQVNRQHFEAYNAALTSSRIGVPRYYFSSQNISFDDVQTPLVDPFTNQALVTPQGGPQVEHQLLATARSNFLYAGGVPIFYWPVIATDLTQPTYYVSGVKFRNDRVFGSSVNVDFDLYQLLGIENKPPGSQWTLSTDYLSLRGPAVGTSFKYEGDTPFTEPGQYRGFIDAWGIYDTGRDNLGLGWRDLSIEDPYRGRALARHRQNLPGEFVLTGELGFISDRNFLEQYYELEWDTFKDESTALDLKRLFENRSLEFSADARVNDFVTETQGVRADHFLLGQSLLFDRLTWHAHSHAGYAQLKDASPPTDPAQIAVISPLPWEADVEGPRAATRHEIDLPLELGPTRIVPYVLGELAYWGEDLSGQQLNRAYFQTGIKASLPIWKSDPTISSELFNLSGLAHKITFDAEFLYADASEDLDQLPLYDQLDDNATEFTRRQMAARTFGQPQGTFVPARFDERFYALRDNLQGSVTSPTEIADDLMEFRFGINQRWQTKRGLAGQQRIIDWIVLDVGAVVFPDSARDNFGASLGLVDYDFRWHLGDRVTLLSDGFYDGFDDGLRQASFAALLSRPEYGNLYFGLRSTEGPISSNVVSSSASYRMSEKWIATGGASLDLAAVGNIGQNVAFTRIGESFLLKVGFNYDASRDNLGVVFAIEPRFLPSSRLGRVGGIQVPPAGALGLE